MPAKESTLLTPLNTALDRIEEQWELIYQEFYVAGQAPYEQFFRAEDRHDVLGSWHPGPIMYYYLRPLLRQYYSITDSSDDFVDELFWFRYHHFKTVDHSQMPFTRIQKLLAKMFVEIKKIPTISKERNDETDMASDLNLYLIVVAQALLRLLYYLYHVLVGPRYRCDISNEDFIKKMFVEFAPADAEGSDKDSDAEGSDKDSDVDVKKVSKIGHPVYEELNSFQVNLLFGDRSARQLETLTKHIIIPLEELTPFAPPVDTIITSELAEKRSTKKHYTNDCTPQFTNNLFLLLMLYSQLISEFKIYHDDGMIELPLGPQKGDEFLPGSPDWVEFQATSAADDEDGGFHWGQRNISLDLQPVLKDWWEDISSYCDSNQLEDLQLVVFMNRFGLLSIFHNHVKYLLNSDDQSLSKLLLTQWQDSDTADEVVDDIHDNNTFIEGNIKRNAKYRQQLKFSHLRYTPSKLNNYKIPSANITSQHPAFYGCATLDEHPLYNGRQVGDEHFKFAQLAYIFQLYCLFAPAVRSVFITRDVSDLDDYVNWDALMESLHSGPSNESDSGSDSDAEDGVDDDEDYGPDNYGSKWSSPTKYIKQFDPGLLVREQLFQGYITDTLFVAQLLFIYYRKYNILPSSAPTMYDFNTLDQSDRNLISMLDSFVSHVQRIGGLVANKTLYNILYYGEFQKTYSIHNICDFSAARLSELVVLSDSDDDSENSDADSVVAVDSDADELVGGSPATSASGESLATLLARLQDGIESDAAKGVQDAKDDDSLQQPSQSQRPPEDVQDEEEVPTPSSDSDAGSDASSDDDSDDPDAQRESDIKRSHPTVNYAALKSKQKLFIWEGRIPVPTAPFRDPLGLVVDNYVSGTDEEKVNLRRLQSVPTPYPSMLALLMPDIVNRDQLFPNYDSTRLDVGDQALLKVVSRLNYIDFDARQIVFDAGYPKLLQYSFNNHYFHIAEQNLINFINPHLIMHEMCRTTPQSATSKDDGDEDIQALFARLLADVDAIGTSIKAALADEESNDECVDPEPQTSELAEVKDKEFEDEEVKSNADDAKSTTSENVYTNDQPTFDLRFTSIMNQFGRNSSDGDFFHHIFVPIWKDEPQSQGTYRTLHRHGYNGVDSWHIGQSFDFDKDKIDSTTLKNLRHPLDCQKDLESLLYSTFSYRLYDHAEGTWPVDNVTDVIPSIDQDPLDECEGDDDEPDDEVKEALDTELELMIEKLGSIDDDMPQEEQEAIFAEFMALKERATSLVSRAGRIDILTDKMKEMLARRNGRAQLNCDPSDDKYMLPFPRINAYIVPRRAEVQYKFQFDKMFQFQFQAINSHIYHTNAFQILDFVFQRQYSLQKIAAIKFRYVINLLANARATATPLSAAEYGDCINRLQDRADDFQSLDDPSKLAYPVEQSYDVHHYHGLLYGSAASAPFGKNSVFQNHDVLALDYPIFQHVTGAHLPEAVKGEDIDEYNKYKIVTTASQYESPYMMAQANNYLYGRNFVSFPSELRDDDIIEQSFRSINMYLIYVFYMLHNRLDAFAKIPILESFLMTADRFSIARRFVTKNLQLQPFQRTLGYDRDKDRMRASPTYCLDGIYRIALQRIQRAIQDDDGSYANSHAKSLYKPVVNQYVEALAAVIHGASNASFASPYGINADQFAFEYFPIINHTDGSKTVLTGNYSYTGRADPQTGDDIDEADCKPLETFPAVEYNNFTELSELWGNDTYHPARFIEHPLFQVVRNLPPRPYRAENSERPAIHRYAGCIQTYTDLNAVSPKRFPIGDDQPDNTTFMPLFAEQYAFQVQYSIESFIELLIDGEKDVELKAILSEIDLTHKIDVPTSIDGVSKFESTLITDYENGAPRTFDVTTFDDEQLGLVDINEFTSVGEYGVQFPPKRTIKYPSQKTSSNGHDYHQTHFGFYQPDAFVNLAPFALQKIDGTVTKVMNPLLSTLLPAEQEIKMISIPTDLDVAGDNVDEVSALDTQFTVHKPVEFAQELETLNRMVNECKFYLQERSGIWLDE